VKILLLISLLFGVTLAQERPKIALVLSGGGARGGAHTGVLKVLEKYHIPIDMIVGTSMGSFIGGLYSAGMTPQEIDDMLVSTEWMHYIRTDYNRQDIPMRKKDIDYTYQGLLGLGINANNELVLPTGVLKRQPMLLKFMELTENTQGIDNFDNLTIPFRAVATNIENGDAVVLDHGSLAKAIYASSSIPGGFQPIRIDGIDLVDGGVSNNIPINVARDMGADIIIAVDVSENFETDLDVNSYFVVMGQLVNILMRKNANESLETLTQKDILLTPDLDGFSGLDADKYREIIDRGEAVALKHKDELTVLSINDENYKKYQKKHRVKPQFHAPIITKIEVQNPTYFSNESILNRIHQKEGEPLNLEQLRADILHLYHRMIFDSIDYELKEEGEGTTLVIKTVPSWDNHGEIRFALGLEDDFSGHSAYSMKLGYTMYGINSYGAEWKTDTEIGRYERAYTEFFQPLDTMQRYYIKPSMEYESVTEIFDRGYGGQEVSSSRYGASFAIGAHVTTDYEFETGASVFEDKISVPVAAFNGKYKVMPIYAHMKIDTLDNVNFPKVGLRSKLLWTKEMHSWGSEYDYEQIYFEIEKPIRFYSNNITLFLKYGNTYKKNDDSVVRLAGTFNLGGLFNLSGYKPYNFIEDNVLLGVMKYTYEIKDGGFFGTLNAPLYVGFSLESGNAWSEDTTDENRIKKDDFKYSGSLYVAADTFLGPVYLALASSIDGDNRAYFYLGEKF